MNYPCVFSLEKYYHVLDIYKKKPIETELK